MNARFTPGQLALLDDALVARRRSLEQRIALHRAGRSRVEQASDILDQDYDDAPQRSADREVELALTDAEVVELARIDQARGRLREAGFGLCGDCGGDIAFDRLKVQPWAERCLACEDLRERASGRLRTPSL